MKERSPSNRVRKKKGTRKETSQRRQTTPKFIPNLSQFQEAVQALPDPEAWEDSSYTHQLDLESEQRSIVFHRKEIIRTEDTASRWVYDGKILIRNRDL